MKYQVNRKFAELDSDEEEIIILRPGMKLEDHKPRRRRKGGSNSGELLPS